MARDQYLEHLKSVPLFSQCSTAELREIGRIADEVTVPAGRILATEGHYGAELFVVVAGTATVSRQGHPVATVGPGHVVGEMAVLAKQPRNATVTAETDLDVLVLTRGGLDQLLDDIPGLAKRLLYEVSARVAGTGDGT